MPLSFENYTYFLVISFIFLFAQDFCWLINGPFRFHVGTVNNKPMLFTPRAFWSFDGYNQLSLTRILCLYCINCMSYFQTLLLHLTVEGYSSLDTVIVQKIFSSGISKTYERQWNKNPTMKYLRKKIGRENNNLLYYDQFFQQNWHQFFIAIFI